MICTLRTSWQGPGIAFASGGRPRLVRSPPGPNGEECQPCWVCPAHANFAAFAAQALPSYDPPSSLSSAPCPPCRFCAQLPQQNPALLYQQALAPATASTESRKGDAARRAAAAACTAAGDSAGYGSAATASPTSVVCTTGCIPAALRGTFQQTNSSGECIKAATPVGATYSGSGRGGGSSAPGAGDAAGPQHLG